MDFRPLLKIFSGRETAEQTVQGNYIINKMACQRFFSFFAPSRQILSRITFPAV